MKIKKVNEIGGGMGQHGPDKTGHLPDRLALYPKADRQSGDLGRGGPAGQHLVQHRFGLVLGQRMAPHDGGEHSGPTPKGSKAFAVPAW